MRLLLNHLSRFFEDFSKNPIKSSVLLEIIYGLKLSESFLMSVLFKIKRKSARNWLNKRRPRNEPWGTANSITKSISCDILYELFTCTLCFLYEK